MAELATVARPYAQALFDVACQGDLIEWSKQIDELASIVSDEKLQQLAKHPKVAAAQVFDVISSIVSKPLNPQIQKFLSLLIENKRLDAFSEVVSHFKSLISTQSGVSEAKIYSAFPMSQSQLDDVVLAFQKRFGRSLKATVDAVEIDPQLIGGVRVIVGDAVLDTSVQARLERMKTALVA